MKWPASAKISFFPKNQTSCSPKQLAPIHHGINRHFNVRKKLVDCQTLDYVVCNGNLAGQNSQKLSIGLIHPGIQTRFSSKHLLSEFLPSRFQSIISFLYKMKKYPHFLCLPILRKFDRLNLPNLCICTMLLSIRINFFRQLPTAFLHQDVSPIDIF